MNNHSQEQDRELWKQKLLQKLFDTHIYFFNQGEYAKALIVAKLSLRISNSIK